MRAVPGASQGRATEHHSTRMTMAASGAIIQGESLRVRWIGGSALVEVAGVASKSLLGTRIDDDFSLETLWDSSCYVPDSTAFPE